MPPIYFMRSKVQQLHPWMAPWKIGHYPKMIFDKPRNQWYWELLKQSKNKICEQIFRTLTVFCAKMYKYCSHRGHPIR